MNYKTKRKWIIGIGIIILLCGIGYSQGFRVTKHLVIGRMGTVTITVPQTLTDIFVDRTTKTTTHTDNQTVTLDLSPGSHEIIVSKDGYFPWVRTVQISHSKPITLNPFFIQKNPTGEMITEYDPQYWKIDQDIANNTPPTKDKPLTRNGSSVWLENNAIIVQKDGIPHIVIQPDTVVRNISWFADRDDVILFSTSNGVFVIETQTDDTQNFMPIYKGESPRFVQTDPHYIYVRDNKNLMLVVI